MIRFSLIFLFLFFSVLLEILMESAGIPMILTGPCLFYIACVFGWKRAVPAGIIAGCFLDFASGMTHPWNALTLMLTIWFAKIWMDHSKAKNLFTLLIPGLLLPLAGPFPARLFHSLWTPGRLGDCCSDLLICTVCCAVLFPPAIIALDTLNHALGVEDFAMAGSRLREKDRL